MQQMRLKNLFSFLECRGFRVLRLVRVSLMLRQTNLGNLQINNVEVN